MATQTQKPSADLSPPNVQYVCGGSKLVPGTISVWFDGEDNMEGVIQQGQGLAGES